MARRASLIALEIGIPIALLGVLWAWSAGSTSFYYPPLSEILTVFRDTWLFAHLGSDVIPSLVRLVIGFLLGSVVAVVLGVVLGLSDRRRRAANPIIEFLRAVPPPALLPFAILMIGVGDAMKVALIAFACVFPVLLNTIDGVIGVDRTLIDTGRAYRITARDRVLRITVPAASPQIFAGLRTSLSLALILMVISEMVASTNGVGYFVLQAQRTFSIAEMWSGIILLGILGYVLNLGLLLVEARVLRWHRASHSSAPG